MPQKKTKSLSSALANRLSYAMTAVNATRPANGGATTAVNKRARVEQQFVLHSSADVS